MLTYALSNYSLTRIVGQADSISVYKRVACGGELQNSHPLFGELTAKTHFLQKARKSVLRGELPKSGECLSTPLGAQIRG